MRIRLVAPLVSAMLAVGATIGVIAWSPWEESSLQATPVPSAAPTPYQRHLTGPEAASKAVAWSYKHFLAKGGIVSRFMGGDQPTCQSQDFNDYTRAWVVTCSGRLQPPDLEATETFCRALDKPLTYSQFDCVEAFAENTHWLTIVDDASGTVQPAN